MRGRVDVLQEQRPLRTTPAPKPAARLDPLGADPLRDPLLRHDGLARAAAPATPPVTQRVEEPSDAEPLDWGAIIAALAREEFVGGVPDLDERVAPLPEERALIEGEGASDSVATETALATEAAPATETAPATEAALATDHATAAPVDDEDVQRVRKKKTTRRAKVVSNIVAEDKTGVRAKLRRGSPSNVGPYTTHAFGGRTYYHQSDTSGRITKYQGRLSFVKGGRSATMKTKNKRKTDQNGHLIAHSFGGDPTFSLGYVAMNKTVNGAGGEWGQMEGYVRKRLQVTSTSAYMAVKPIYPPTQPNMFRPTSVRVSLYFNRSPFKITFLIDTP